VLSVFCVSVTLVNDGLLDNRIYAHNFASNESEYRNNFDTVTYGKVCSCEHAFNFLQMLLIGDTTKH